MVIMAYKLKGYTKEIIQDPCCSVCVYIFYACVLIFQFLLSFAWGFVVFECLCEAISKTKTKKQTYVCVQNQNKMKKEQTKQLKQKHNKTKIKIKILIKMKPGNKNAFLQTVL